MRARILALLRRFRGAPPVTEDAGPDLLAPEAVRNPYPLYAALRERGPVHFLPRYGFWLVVGYDEAEHALKHPALFSSVRTPVRFDPILNEADPPAHTRARRSVAPIFSPAAVQAMEDLTRAAARELLAGVDELDLVNGFGVPLTERVAGAFLGLAAAESAELARLLDPHRHTEDGRYFTVLEEWFRDYAATLPGRATPVPGHALLRHADGSVLDPAEIAGMIRMVWVAGTTTTGRLIPAAALQLLLHPELRARVADDAELLPAFVEEAARLNAPEQLLWRIARPGAEIGGTAIPEGAEVRVSIGAANRDPARFHEPDAVRLDREPARHLTFGAGPHFCPGTRLARLQVRVALETLLAEWPRFAAAKPLDTLEYVPAIDHRALRELVVTSGRAA